MLNVAATPRFSKPQARTINRNHPIGAKVALAFLMDSNGGVLACTSHDNRFTLGNANGLTLDRCRGLITKNSSSSGGSATTRFSSLTLPTGREAIDFSEVAVLWAGNVKSGSQGASNGGWNDLFSIGDSTNNMICEIAGSGGTIGLLNIFTVGTITGSSSIGGASPAPDMRNERFRTVVWTASKGRNQQRLLIDGRLLAGTNTWSASGAVTSFLLSSRLSDAGGRIIDATHNLCVIFNQSLSAEEATEVGVNPYLIFRPLKTISLNLVAAGDTTLTPAAGALTLTGYAPTVAATDNKTLTPAAASLTLTGYAPTVSVSDNVFLAPAAGTLTLTGQTSTQKTTLAPAAGALTLTGYAPVVATTGDQTLAPAAGAVTLAGYAPTLKLTVPVAAGSLTLSGNGVVLETPVAPAAGSLVVSGYAPTVDVTENATVSIPVGTLILSGETAVVVTTDDVLVSVPSGTLQLTGRTPTVSNSVVGDNDTYLVVDPINPDTLNLYVEGVLLARFSQQNINVNGGFALKVVTKTTDYTATIKDAVILCDASGGAFAITLPASAGAQGLMLYIKKTDASANAVTIDGDGSETVDGAATLVLASQYDAARLVADGTGWAVI